MTKRKRRDAMHFHGRLTWCFQCSEGPAKLAYAHAIIWIEAALAGAGIL